MFVIYTKSPSYTKFTKPRVRSTGRCSYLNTVSPLIFINPSRLLSITFSSHSFFLLSHSAIKAFLPPAFSSLTNGQSGSCWKNVYPSSSLYTLMPFSITSCSSYTLSGSRSDTYFFIHPNPSPTCVSSAFLLMPLFSSTHFDRIRG